MKKALRKKLFLIALVAFMAMFGATMDSAQVLADPLGAELTGTFLPPAEKGDLNTYVLWSKEKKRHFKVTNAVFTESSISWHEYLNQLEPPQMHLIGDKKSIKHLMESKVVGKTFILKGMFYLSAGVFVIQSQEEVSKKGGSS